MYFLFYSDDDDEDYKPTSASTPRRQRGRPPQAKYSPSKNGSPEEPQVKKLKVTGRSTPSKRVQGGSATVTDDIITMVQNDNVAEFSPVDSSSDEEGLLHPEGNENDVSDSDYNVPTERYVMCVL